MKKLLLGFSVFTAGLTFGQVSIQLDGMGADISGTTVLEVVDSQSTFPLETHLVVTNTGQTNQQWTITRVKVDVPASWSDQVCWPPSCYPTSGDVYVTPNSGGNPAPIIVAGTDQTTNAELAEIKPRITPELTVDNYALYMFYVTDLAGNYVDSVGIQVNFTVGIEEALPALNVSVAPNPASENVTVSAEGVSNASVQMVDILGNKVYEGTVSGQETIDVSTLNNGVYFVMIEAEGVKPVNKKIVVRH